MIPEGKITQILNNASFEEGIKFIENFFEQEGFGGVRRYNRDIVECYTEGWSDNERLLYTIKSLDCKFGYRYSIGQTRGGSFWFCKDKNQRFIVIPTNEAFEGGQ